MDVHESPVTRTSGANIACRRLLVHAARQSEDGRRSQLVRAMFKLDIHRANPGVSGGAKIVFPPIYPIVSRATNPIGKLFILLDISPVRPL
jgi:hypothetical protein